jgi:hypothetical protein
MAGLPYAEQLKHPNWQRRRLESLNRAGFKCEGCYDGESTLYVHHKRYVKGRMAWEYELGELAVLCEECHAQEHAGKVALDRLFAAMSIDGPWSASDAMSLLAGWAAGFLEQELCQPLLTNESAFQAGLLAWKLHRDAGTLDIIHLNDCLADGGEDFLLKLIAFVDAYRPPERQAAE